MGSRIQLLVVALLFGCSDDTLLGPKCGGACYSGPAETRRIGECRDGVEVCMAETSSCVGQVLPAAESCGTGLDTDCNGRIGDDVHEREWCGVDIGACEPGQLQCVDGVLACIGAVGPTSEDCSGTDRDCDGLVDNIEATVCYDGDPRELLPPEAACRAGATACVAGQVACVGQVLPREEICGLKLDRNCNGLIDDGAPTVDKSLDIIVLLDRSCSMSYVDERVRGVLAQFAENYAERDYRFGLVDVPGSFTQTVPEMALQLTDADSFRRVIEQHGALFGGHEYSYDALMMAALNTFGFDLRSSRRLVLWFGDEEAQTNAPVSELAVADALADADFTTLVFIDTIFALEYDDIVNATGGSIFSLYDADVATLDAIREYAAPCP